MMMAVAELLKTVNGKTILVFTTTLVLVSIAVSKISRSLHLRKRLKSKSKNCKHLLKFPPTFPSAPVVGSMPFLPKFSKLHEYFTEHADTYGPVVAVHFASEYVIMLIGKEAIYDAFVKKGADFAGRPKFKFDEFLKKTRKGIIVRQYDDDFKLYHKLTVNILRKFGFGSKIMEIRIHHEVNILMKELDTLNGQPVCPSLLLFQSVLNVVSSLLLGKRFEPGDEDRDAIVDLIRRSFSEFRELVVVNFFPFLRFVPKFKRALERGKKLKRDIYNLMDSFIDKCLQSEDEDNFICEFIKEDSKAQIDDNLINAGPDFGNTNNRPFQIDETHQNVFVPGLVHRKNLFPMNRNDNVGDADDNIIDDNNDNTDHHHQLKSSSQTPKYDREQLILTLNDLFKAGTETTVSTLEWAFIMMANHPHVQDRCFKDIERVVGRTRLPSISDKLQMPYLEATIYEIMRHKPVTPLAIPHCTNKDTEVLGYFVPAGTTVFGNLYSALKGVKSWGDPDVFRPERFLSSEDDSVVVNKESVVNFSMGKRSCTGEILARHEVFLFLTCILQRFNIVATPDGQQITTKQSSSSSSELPKVDFKEVMDVSLKPTDYKLCFINRI